MGKKKYQTLLDKTMAAKAGLPKLMSVQTEFSLKIILICVVGAVEVLNGIVLKWACIFIGP